MSTTLRQRVAAVLTALAVGASVATAAPATAAEKKPSRISVFSSDYRVESGEQFVLRGRMFSLGKPVAGAKVRVQTYRAGAWRQLTGAVVSTGSEGRYRVRVILGSTGLRKLRVVGDPKGDVIRIARATTEVRVTS